MALSWLISFRCVKSFSSRIASSSSGQFTHAMFEAYVPPFLITGQFLPISRSFPEVLYL